MKVTLLILEGFESEMANEVKNLLRDSGEKSNYEKVLAEINNQEDSEPSTIFVDMTKFMKTTDFYFKKDAVNGLFISTKMTKYNQEIMVININGHEYDCLYEESVFQELKQFLNN